MHSHGSHRHADGSTSQLGAFEHEALAAALEVEARLTTGLTEEALGSCASRFAASGHIVRRIIDLGCGPGIGTLQLARAFPAATVLAVDGSRTILDLAAVRVRDEPRIALEQLDLDGDLTGLGQGDLVWAAMVLHHAEEPVETLVRVRSLLKPGALLCILERAEPTWLDLRDDLGRPGLWDRLIAARGSGLESIDMRLPGATRATEYPLMLAAAGLELVDQRLLACTVPAPAGAAGNEFLVRHLGAIYRELVDLAEPADAEALGELVEAVRANPEGRWDGAEVTLSRRLFIARSTGATR